MLTIQKMVDEIDNICEDHTRREICIRQENIGYTTSDYDDCSYENRKLIFSNDTLLDQTAIFNESDINTIEQTNDEGEINYIIEFNNGLKILVEIFLA